MFLSLAINSFSWVAHYILGIFNSVIQAECQCFAYFALLTSSSCSLYVENQSNGEERVKVTGSLPTGLALLAPPRAEGGHVYHDFKLYEQVLLLLPLQSPRNSEQMEARMDTKRGGWTFWVFDKPFPVFQARTREFFWGFLHQHYLVWILGSTECLLGDTYSRKKTW